VRHGLVLAAVGLGIALPTASGVTRLLASQLFGVSPPDPVSYGAVPTLLAMSAAVASQIAVHRATAVDPVEVLKVE
jgi:hypothetical protein